MTDIAARLDAGASILNISAAADTPRVVADIKRNFPNVPVIATGGPTDESIEATIRAGANTISYTPPSAAEIFASIMSDYRKKGTGGDDSKEETDDYMFKRHRLHQCYHFPAINPAYCSDTAQWLKHYAKWLPFGER